jgi:multiple sugar transport system ATP-binding protein
VLLPDEPLSNLDARLRLAARTFPGRIRRLGTPREVFQLPADTFVANFIGSTPMNLIEGRARGGRVECAGAGLPGPPGLADGTPVVVGVRPEYLIPADDGITGRVVAVENLGVSSSGRSRPPPSGATPVRATA